MSENIPLEQIDSNRWCILKRYNDAMNIPGIVYADNELIQMIQNDNALQ